MNTPSLEPKTELMTIIKRFCDHSHRFSQTIKNPARGGANETKSPTDSNEISG